MPETGQRPNIQFLFYYKSQYLKSKFRRQNSWALPWEDTGGSLGRSSTISENTVAQTVKNPPADPASIPESGRSPGEGNGYPHQYSCLGNPMDLEEPGG